jgi:DNA primase
VIEKNIIQQILETASIVDVVGDYVSLKKRGSRYLGLCPFHNEKTPSFTVTPKLGIYKCFGCGKGGDVVNFLMEHEKFSYPDALKFLAQRYNIEIVEEEQSPETKEAQKLEESLFQINDFAMKYFSHCLHATDEGKTFALTYFKERGFREDIIKKFNLGYAVNEWTNFTDHALRNGFKLDHLEKTGLTILKEDKKYDRFKGRIIFPIQNISGRVLGFGGRTLLADKKVAKYLNSPESEIYHKSSVLYGINLAKSAIISADTCYLVEGYTDVISLHQAGIENVVASSGTSLTTGQIKLISRYTKNITILYDGDEAGIKAAFRGIDLILEEGMDVKIVLFPEGEDPDSFARKHRSSEVEEFITSNSKNFILFKAGLLLAEAKGDPMKMAGLTGEIVQSVALIPNQVLQRFYIKECASLLNIGEDTLMNELNKLRRKKFDKKLREAGEVKDETPLPLSTTIPAARQQTTFDLLSSEPQEKDLIRLLITFADQKLIFETEEEDEKWEFTVADYIIQSLEGDQIEPENSLYRKFIRVTSQELQTGRNPDTRFYLSNPDPEVSAAAASLIINKYELSDWKRVKIKVKTEEEQLIAAVTVALHALKLRLLEKQYEVLLKELEKANPEDVLVILSQQRKIQLAINRFSEEMARFILR